MKLKYSNERDLTQSEESLKYEETSSKIFFANFGNIFVDDSSQAKENLQAWSRRCHFTTV
jgi:hypothetical protein